jgi:hypothetical protein
MSARRALVCAPVMPEADRESSFRRIVDWIEYLRDEGWSVSLVAGQALDSERWLRLLQQRGVATCVGFDALLSDEMVRAADFDLAVLASWQVAESQLPQLRRVSPRTRVLIDSMGLHLRRNTRRVFQRAGPEDQTAFLDQEVASEIVREINAYAAADGVLAVSEKEAGVIEDLTGNSVRTFAVPDAADLAPSSAAHLGAAHSQPTIRDLFWHAVGAVLACTPKRGTVGWMDQATGDEPGSGQQRVNAELAGPVPPIGQPATRCPPAVNGGPELPRPGGRPPVTATPGWPGSGICPNPVFIIGAPRSGTTALALSLAQHSQLWTSAESDVLYHLFEKGHAESAFQKAITTPGQQWLRKHEVGKQEFLAFLGLGLNALFTSRSGGRRWIDQTPLYTLITDQLVDLFPGACFIHILRDGRRVVNSMIHFLQSDGVKVPGIGAKVIGSWSTNFREACKTWRHYTRQAMALCSARPDRCRTVVNEQLLADPRGGFRSLCSFLGLPYEDGPACFFATNRVNSSFHNDSTTSAAPRANINPWTEWTMDQKRIFLEEAGSTLLEYGLATAEELIVDDLATRK